MRKLAAYLLMLAALLLVSLPLRAQRDTLAARGFLYGWNVGVSAGGNGFFFREGRGFGGKMMPDVDIYVGKALSPIASVRLGFQQGGMSYRFSSEPITYAYVHGDVLVDLPQVLFGMSPTRIWSVSPFMHFGLLGLVDHRALIEREYASGAGIEASLRLFPGLTFTTSARTSIYTGAVARGAGHLGNLVVLGGFRWDFSRVPMWQMRPGDLALNGFWDNWFVSLQGGVNTIGQISHFQSGWAPAVDAAVGKWLSPYFGLRLGWQGLEFEGLGKRPISGVEVTPIPDSDLLRERFGFGYVHGDVLWNVLRYKPGSRWASGPYLHMGFLYETTRSRELMGRYYAGGVGWFTDFRITRRLGIQAEIRGFGLNGHTAGDAGGGIVMAWSGMAGLNYRIGGTDWGHVEPKAPKAPKEPKVKAEKTPKEPRATKPKQDKKEKAEKQKAGADSTKVTDSAKVEIETTEVPVPEKLITERPVAEKADVKKAKVDKQKTETAGLEKTGPGYVPQKEALQAKGAQMQDLSREAVELWLMPSPFRHSLKKAGEPYRVGHFLDNWSASLTLGTTEGAMAADLTVTKWVLPQVGGRFGYQGLTLSGTQDTRGYAYIHQDLLINVVDLVAGYKPSRRYKVAPYVHFGVITEYDGSAIPLQVRNFEYAGGFGLLTNYALDKRFGISAEYRATMLTGEVSLTGSMRATSAFLVGLQYHFGQQGWKPVGTQATDGLRMGRFWDNWYLSGAVGLNLLTDVHGSGSLNGLAADLSVGKWVTPQFGLRMGYQGVRAARIGRQPHSGVWAVEQGGGVYREELGFVYVHGDFLWNVSQTLLPYRQDRIWSFVPYAHMGALVEYGVGFAPHHMFERELAAGAGLMNSFRVNQDIDLYVDARLSVLRSEASGDDRSSAGLMPSVLLGITRRLGPQGFAVDAAARRPQPSVERSDRSRWALSLNLGDAALLGTIGVSAQWAPARHWSVESGLRFNPFSYKDHTLFDLRQSFNAGARWWPWHVYSGWFVRSVAQVESVRRYGMEPLVPDFTGESYGLTLGGGYALLLSPHFNLEFGLGAFGGRRREHSSSAGYQWFVTPDALLLSLSWVF